MTECPLNGADNGAECCGMSGDGQSVEQGRSLLGRDVELSRGSICYVDCNDARYFLSKRLDRDYHKVNHCRNMNGIRCSHGCHLRSAPSKAPTALLWNDLLVVECKVEALSLHARSVGAVLALSLLGVLGGVLNGFPLTSTTLAEGGAKSVPLNTAAVSALTCCLSGAGPVLPCASISACSADHIGARARSFAGCSEKRLV